MRKFEPITYGNYYHIYNRGINSCNLFAGNANYEYFLHLYNKYISPVADTFTWVLMPNHFHLLVRIKEGVFYTYSNADRSIDPVRFNEIKWETSDLSACKAPDSVQQPNPAKHFSHLFNAYAKYFNLRNDRHGNLFERPFRRKKIETKEYLQKLILYIHNNPVHHGFCKHAMEYPWSSYLSCVSIRPTRLRRDEVVGWFDNLANFKLMHEQQEHIQVEWF